MIIEQDILEIQTGIIVHQVNCQGVMGGGLAYAIRKKYPVVYQAYQKNTPNLGQIQLIRVGDDLWVCNLAGQDEFGIDRCYTDYEAHQIAWPKLAKWASERNLTIYAPWMIGCGLAGGDWSIIQPLVEELCPGVVWCKHED